MKSRQQALSLFLDTVVVVAVQIINPFSLKVFQRIKFLQTEQFPFEQTKEVFHYGIVQTVTFPAHALPDILLMIMKHLLVLFAFVLPALIGVKVPSGILSKAFSRTVVAMLKTGRSEIV